jgi:hypothetical protein
MDLSLLNQYYDRYGAPLSNPTVSYQVSGASTNTASYIVTAFNETGETNGSVVTINNAPDTLNITQYITLSWKAINNAKGYNVYKAVNANTYGFLTQLDSSTTQFTDYGVLVPNTGIQPPATNTTGRLNWDSLAFLPGRYAQSAELNELQSILNAKLKSVGDAVFNNGDIIRGCSLTIDKTGNATITEGLVYIEGAVRYVATGQLVIPTTGTYYVGINVVRRYIDDTDDPILKDPAQGYPGYATAGAARQTIDFQWVFDSNKSNIDVVIWTVVNGALTKIVQPQQASGMDSIISRKIYDLRGNVLIYGLKAKALNDPTYRNLVTIEVDAGKAYVNGKEILKPASSMSINIAQDKSDSNQEEVSVWNGLLYNPDVIPLAEVDQVTVRVKVAETRLIPSAKDSCNWFFDDTGVSLDSILGVWKDSTKATTYTFSNSDPGCANRSTKVVLSGTGFALNPSTFSSGQSYYIEYLKYETVTKGVRQRANHVDTFTYANGTTQYQLTKSDVMESNRSPIVVTRVSDGHVYVEGTDYSVNLGRSYTAVGPASITWLVQPQDKTQFTVSYYYWDHLTEGDYVSVDSYVKDLSSYDYDEIEYPNAIDFRTNGVKPATQNTNIIVQYKAYLSKWGWLQLNDDGTTSVLFGDGATIPAKPKRPDLGLPLYLIYFPAASQNLLFTAETSYNVRRDYDVNALYGRFDNIEDNLALTMSEVQLLSKETLTPKKGMFVDSFVDASQVDVNNSTISMDMNNGLLFTKKSWSFGSINLTNSYGVYIGKNIILPSFTETVFDKQLMWTDDYAVEINPYAVFSPYVTVSLFPSTDFWINTVETVSVHIETVTTYVGVSYPAYYWYPYYYGYPYYYWYPYYYSNPYYYWLYRGYLPWNMWYINPYIPLYSWAYSRGTSVASKQSSITSVEILPNLRQRVVVVQITNCLPHQDVIRGYFEGVSVPLSVATQADLNSAGATKLVPAGSNSSVAGAVKADSNGTVIAKFTIPPNIPAGERVFECKSDDGLVDGKATYNGYGLLERIQTVYNEIQYRTLYYYYPVYDPLAQSFYVEDPVFITSVTVWAHRIPVNSNYGLTAAIRKLDDSGFPGQYVYGQGSVTKAQIMQMMGISDPSQTVEVPTMNNGITIEFDDPVYLESGWYVVAIGSASNDYYMFTAKGGNKVLGNLDNPTWSGIGNSLSRQAHDGVLFLSYNGTTWETDMSRDLMFQLNKAVFNTSTQSSVSLSVSGVTFPVHEFTFSAVTKVPTGSMLNSYYNAGAGDVPFRIEDFDSEKSSKDVVPINVGTNANQLNVDIKFSTSDSDVAPFIYLNKWGVVVWTYASSGSYYSQVVNINQLFSNVKLWINELDNGGSVSYKMSFDGNTWYTLPVINSIPMNGGWVENELGGALSSITNNAVGQATEFIVRADLTCSSNNLWLSPTLSSLRVLVY